MNIKFLVNNVFDGWSPEDRRLGGTEESIVHWAQELQKMGHDVTVFNGGGCYWNGIIFVKREQYEADGGITINVKSPEIAPRETTFYLTNETDASKHDLSAFAGVILPSKWAADNLGIRHPNIKIVPHGFNPILREPLAKINNRCIYASSPDRGLTTLKMLWPRIVEQVPGASLVLTYGGEFKSGKNIIQHEATEDEMDTLFRACDFWLHPCSGGELFCMSGIKAQVAGAIPVYFPTMALSETVRHGVSCNSKNFVENIVRVMQDPVSKQIIRDKLAKEHYQDWTETAKVLLWAIGL